MYGVICRAVLVLFTLLYAGALALLAVGTFGLFGVEPDPLSGVYVIALGLPWIWLVDAAPEALSPWLAAVAPIINIALLRMLCRLAERPPR